MAVRDLRRRFPEFEKLLSERLAIYQAKTEARIPLDFTTELLPAETQVHDKVELDGKQPPPKPRGKRSHSSTSRGCFENAASASEKSITSCKSTRWIAARPASGMICRHFGRKVSLSRIRQLCHTATDGTSLKAIAAPQTNLDWPRAH